MRPVTAFLAVAALLAACDSPTQPVSGETTTAGPELLKEHVGEVLRQALSFVVNGCNGELVTITGEQLHVFNGVGPGVETGNYTNFTDFVKLSATGVGESGTQYVVNFAEHFTFESPSPEADHVSLIFHGGDILVSQGPDGNFIGHFTFHLVARPTGFEVVTTFESGECRG